MRERSGIERRRSGAEGNLSVIYIIAQVELRCSAGMFLHASAHVVRNKRGGGHCLLLSK